jgi:hypothetical protein
VSPRIVFFCNKLMKNNASIMFFSPSIVQELWLMWLDRPKIKFLNFFQKEVLSYHFLQKKKTKTKNSLRYWIHNYHVQKTKKKKKKSTQNNSVAGWWRRSLPSLAKELASETDSWDNKVSTQVRFIREKGKAALRDGQEPESQ